MRNVPELVVYEGVNIYLHLILPNIATKNPLTHTLFPQIQEWTRRFNLI
jgi:hypothetical protein